MQNFYKNKNLDCIHNQIWQISFHITKILFALSTHQ